MSTREFFLYIFAVAIGTTIALAIAGLYVKAQLSAATTGNSTVGALLSLFGSKPAGT